MNPTVVPMPKASVAFADDKAAELQRSPSSHQLLSMDSAWLRRTEAEHLHGSMMASEWSVSRAKRILDVVCSAAALILLSPLMLLIAVLVRCSSEGPVFFRQRRAGLRGQLFTIYKFRSMEATKSGPSHTRHDDPRITGVGRILRKYKLDELPQFYNVFTGDMSLVGPRPKLPHHEAGHLPFRPGLTGAATLAFRCEEEMLVHVPEHELEAFYNRTIKPLKLHLDSEYMKQATLKSDLAMICETAKACLLRNREQWRLDLSLSA